MEWPCRGCVHCYSAVMTVFLRYLGIALIVLIVAVAFTVCGDGAFETCAHACCMKSDRADRLRKVIGRAVAAFSAHLGSPFTPAEQSRPLASLLLAVPSSNLALAAGVSPIRT